MKQILVAASCGLLSLMVAVPGSSIASNQNANEALSLTVRVKSRHVSYFEACVPVRVNEPFQLVWGSETVKEIVSGTVGAPVGQHYPTTLKISEGNGQCRTETQPKLDLDKPDEWSNLVSAAFNHIDTYRFVLSKKPCEITDVPSNALDVSGGSVFRNIIVAEKVD